MHQRPSGTLPIRIHVQTYRTLLTITWGLFIYEQFVSLLLTLPQGKDWVTSLMKIWRSKFPSLFKPHVLNPTPKHFRLWGATIIIRKYNNSQETNEVQNIALLHITGLPCNTACNTGLHNIGFLCRNWHEEKKNKLRFNFSHRLMVWHLKAYVQLKDVIYSGNNPETVYL